MKPTTGILILAALGFAVSGVADAQTSSQIASQSLTALNQITTNTGAAQASTTSGQPGPLVQCAVTTAAPTYTTATTNPINCDTAGNQRVSVTNSNPNGQAAMTGSSPVVVASDQTGSCTGVIAISQTASTDLKTSVAKLNICSIVLISASAQNISLVEGTGTTCATGTAALIGGTTASVAVPANGGFSAVSSVAWLKTQTTADHLCLLQSGSGNVSGVITFLDHS